MSLQAAKARLHARPILESKVDPRWLGTQAGKGDDEFHPLYGLLESASTDPGIDTFLDGLERTLGAGIRGRVASRARRLTGGDRTDYWSAVDELSIAARLSGCGLAATVGEPDIVVDDGSASLALELTAPERTRELEALQQLLASEWHGPGSLTLVLARQTWKPNARERRAIADRVAGAAAASPIDVVEVPLGGICDPRVLRIEVDPTLPLGVASQSEADFGAYDPVPDLESAIGGKRKQLRSMDEVVVAVDLWALDLNPITFGIRSALGLSAGDPLPTITSHPNVVGAIAFFRGVPGEAPMAALWLKNERWTGPLPVLLSTVLDCLAVLR